MISLDADQGDIGILLYDDVGEYHFDSIKFKKTKFYKNVEDFCQADLRVKYAVYHVPWEPEKDTWPAIIDDIYNSVNKVFLLCSELHEYTVKNLIKFDKPKVAIFICGHINYEFKHAKIYKWMDWFHTTCNFYKYVKPDLLIDQLQNIKIKNHFFDILLGCRRQHRDFVYDYVKNKNLISKNIMTYHKFWHLDVRQTDYIVNDNNIEFMDGQKYGHTSSHVKYYGHEIALSQIIPFSIYNDSYYSLVAETNAVNEFNFYTEKIVKPILGKRLFIVIAGKGYLKNLKLFGFQTFDSVIDESYDNEENHEKRWLMALEQMEFLINQDPLVIKEKIRSITQYNQNLMLNFDWFSDHVCNIQHAIDQFAPNEI